MPDDLADLVTSVPDLLLKHPAIAPGLAMAKMGGALERGYHRLKKRVMGPGRRTTDIRLPDDRPSRKPRRAPIQSRSLGGSR